MIIGRAIIFSEGLLKVAKTTEVSKNVTSTHQIKVDDDYEHHNIVNN